MNIIKRKSFRLSLYTIFVGCLIGIAGTYDVHCQVSPKERVFGPADSAVLSRSDSIIRNKVFYLLALLEKNKDVNKVIREDSMLSIISKRHTESIKRSLNHYDDVRKYASAIEWNKEEVNSIGDRLVALFKFDRGFQKIMLGLERSKKYINDEYLPDTAFIRKCWNEAAYGINRILQVYMAGKMPHYAIIDSISFKINDPGFKRAVSEMIEHALTVNVHSGVEPFYKIPLYAALKVLAINGRDEPARYMPITGGRNAKPYERVKHIKWGSYQYSVILLPGFGPERPGVAISTRGKERCKMAALRYKKGLAPFIITSGGHVYPFRTPYSEAVEMKKYMTSELGIPDDAVIIEPYARHTTTNIRNANRLIFEFGIPVNKPVLVVTDSAQTKMIDNLAPRCMRELGYVPYQDLKILNKEESQYYPVINVFQANAADPLDP